jgi:cellulose synthase/poly-beta-1,6-N-acetylglucosamine synthase-like glycosyltransferase
MVWILNLFLIPLTAVMTAYLIRHFLFTLTALYYRRGQPHYIPNRSYEPTVSILIPANNEEKVIGRILQRMTELTYPKEKLEAIVIDDASTDGTSEIVEKFAREHEQIKVIHRKKGEGGKGKSVVLNEGLKHSNGEIIFCFDADYYPQRDIVEKLAAYFVDPKVGAVQGRVTVLNEPNTLVTRLVALERIGGYRVDQLARDDLRLIPQFGGTVGGFRRGLLESLGGWDPHMLAEDTDLTFRAYLAGYKIRYVNEAECYEEAVETWRSYGHQRYRWAKGHMQAAFKHLWPLIRSQNLSLREKIDGFLLLNIYFMPLLVVLAWVLEATSYSAQSSEMVVFYWFLPSIFIYSAIGNFAPFFEVGIGAYLDGRERICRLIPLLFVAFLFNVVICAKAFFDLCISKIMGNNCHKWAKTFHSGNGNNFIGANNSGEGK